MAEIIDNKATIHKSIKCFCSSVVCDGKDVIKNKS
jgi:hypothetical protein